MKIIVLPLALILLNVAHAKDKNITHNYSSLKAGCSAATAQRDLDINNVRTTILNGGDMWWNLSNARYEIPKASAGNIPKHSLSAGSLWLGGVTNDNLRIAAQTYRQAGNDFYPGPLSTTTASITQQECKSYDRIWKITLSEIQSFKNNPSQWQTPSTDFSTWPAMGDLSQKQAKYLAPFMDVNGNGVYEPNVGDYPSFTFNTSANIPDMMLFWIYNDRGNIHFETNGMPIGLELQEFAFAYSTNNHLNNSTFYKTTIINRGNETIDSFVIAKWADGSIGNDNDDYVQMDLSQKMMITYNADDDDEGLIGYGINPPSVGIVMLQGPLSDTRAEIPLNSFMVYNDDQTVQGNPSRPENYWNYMNHRWKNYSPLTYGGSGIGGSDTTNFMYPGLTDNKGRREWTENTEQNTPGDRKMVLSYAPFSLLPGAVNTVMYAVVWARATSGGAKGSLPILDEACDQAKTFYQNFIKTGIDERKQSTAKVHLYPNPGSTEISVDGEFDTNSDITFFDIEGHVVLKSKLQQHISVDRLSSGIYFYKISNPTNTILQMGKWLKR